MHGMISFAVRLSMLLVVLLAVLSGCAPAPASAPTLAATTTVTSPPISTATVTPEPTLPTTTSIPATATVTPDLRQPASDWQAWPIIPDISPAMKAIFAEGQRQGRDPHVFSVLGDCQSSPTYFINLYDENRYTLSDDEAHLQKTIDWFAGSFSHRSITVKNGMTAPGALNPRWADPAICEPQETPLACEIRNNNPSIILISLGTNWLPATSQENYLAYLNKIIDIALEQGVVPVLSTKADNLEGDYRRNLAVAQVAYDRQVPLWNFWAAVSELPNHGLDHSRQDAYLNHRGWDIRNRSALELLDSLRQQLND